MAESDPFLENRAITQFIRPSDRIAHERRKKKEKRAKAKEISVGYFELFNYADSWDYFLIGIGLFISFIRGLTFPVGTLVYSELVAMFIERNSGIGTSSMTYLLPLFNGGKILTNATHEENMDELKKDSISFGIIMTLVALVMFISGIIAIDIFNHVALTITSRLRKSFFEATIRQDVGWHDTAKNQNFALRITDNMEKIRNGIAENITQFLMLFFDIIFCVIMSFVYGWKLTAIVFAYVPIAIILNVLVAKFQAKYTTEEQNSYAHASTVVEESIGAIRTVAAFGGENEESNRFEKRLIPGQKAGIKRGICSGICDAVLKSLIFFSTAATFMCGSYLVVEDRFKDIKERDYTPAIVMVVVMGIAVSSDRISRTVPFLEAFALARGSAFAIYNILDRESKIDPLSVEGKTLSTPLRGNIQFEDVFFRYPSREDVIVLRGLNFQVNEGETVALVGYSGCGKSTCVQLIQRFYDPDFGKIMIDNMDICKYNIGWLRKNIAVVGQEPVLFYGTIAENIRHGKSNATQKEVEEASKSAGAHDFITALSDGYNTVISERGVQLSGGQRQRIAIARALIQNPKILLLDEATSALDYHSEKLVQAALDKASIGRTTIVVSHRLSAIKNANHIIFLDSGKISEQGTHQELVKLGGKYAEMVNAHEMAKDDEKYDNYESDEREKEDHKQVITTADVNKRFDQKETESFEMNGVESLDENGKLKNMDLPLDKLESLVKIPGFVRTFFRILRTAKREWPLLVVATICAGIYGSTQPGLSIIYAEFFGALALQTDDEIINGTTRMAIICTTVGIITSLVTFVQTYLFNKAGVLLTSRMRSLTFRSILQQEVGWFDRVENSVGALSARLAGDAANVQSAVGFPLSNLIQALANFLLSFSIAFAYSWKLSLICLITSPLMIASIVFEALFIAKSAIKESQVLENTSRIATEAISQIRTVAALHRESDLIDQYELDLALYRKNIKKRLRFRGVINSLGLSIMFVGYGITIAYGGVMVSKKEIEFKSVMKIANSLLYGLFLLAQSLAFTPAFNAAITSAGRLYQIIDRESKIQSPDLPTNSEQKTEGFELRTTNINTVKGVTWQDISFSYPTRPKQRVLKNFNLEVHRGQTVALVGPSGSGKSTCVQLLLRYYDPLRGKIFIDQDDIHRNMTLSTVRRRLGVVSQEPSLFEKTIAENIAYGDTSRVVPLVEIMEAAKMANAHNFIVKLPEGYETKMGARGTQLSGGQKQRIAIARALVRNPRILLLDEATSALDLQSERVVQVALDEACAGRTCIVIAHRLSTVQNAHIICVLRNGHIVERGNHAELLAKNGIYAKLYRSQPKSN